MAGQLNSREQTKEATGSDSSTGSQKTELSSFARKVNIGHCSLKKRGSREVSESHVRSSGRIRGVCGWSCSYKKGLKVAVYLEVHSW